ncbi:S1C family serine protease [Planctomicrobium sp. SH668]|uniref:S1C family serine protease n=1 Tax=Planctomicrobium sp. SH668 TaxID=3448126 RepID=UPI003F5C95DD
MAQPPSDAGLKQPSRQDFSEVLLQAGRHLASITAKTMPSVVNIESVHSTRSGDTEETGSGVIMRSPVATGVFVITNRHVVADSALGKISIWLNDGRVLHPTEKLEDPASDLAVLRIEDVGVQPAQFGDSDNLDIGNFVLAMGSPFGLTESVTLGIISAKGRRSLELPGRKVINQDFLQTDAAINPGNSGGPLIDLDGRVIGINTAIASQGGGNEGIGFSIPSNLVQFVVNQLLESGRVRRGYLGVQLDEHFDFEAAKRYGLDRRRGARVTQVIDRTPASIAGLRADDIVINFDGFDVLDQQDLINKVSITPVNKQVRLIILRNGEQQVLNVVLTEKEESSMSSTTPAPVPAPQVPRGLEFSVMPLTEPLSIQAGFQAGQRGVLVKSVSFNGDDENSLCLYDVVEQVSRVPVRTLAEFDREMSRYQEGEEVLLQVKRQSGGVLETHLVVYRCGPRDESVSVEQETF